MKVKIFFFSPLRQILGLKETDIELPEGATVVNLFEELSNRFGEPVKKYIYHGKTGRPRGYLLYSVDEKNQSTSYKIDTKLKGGEKLAIMSPPMGG